MIIWPLVNYLGKIQTWVVHNLIIILYVKSPLAEQQKSVMAQELCACEALSSSNGTSQWQGCVGGCKIDSFCLVFGFLSGDAISILPRAPVIMMPFTIST